MTKQQNSKRPPTNYRELRKQQERKFIWMALLALIIVGSIVIWLVYGIGAVLTALPCLLGGGALISLGYFLLSWLEKWLDRRA